MEQAHNPLIPPVYDLTWSVFAVATIVLFVVAVISLARSASRLGPAVTVAWVALLLIVPVLGPIGWLTVGRSSVKGTRGRA